MHTRSTLIVALAIVAVFLQPRCEAACASTYSNGTCVSCTIPATQYGPYCLTCPCLRGTCNAGVLGNGLCTSCNALTYGPYCDRNYPLQASNLLNWTQICLCFGMFTMTIAVLWTFVRVAVYREPPTTVVTPKETVEQDDDLSLPKVTSARSVDGEDDDDSKSDPVIHFHQATAELMGHEPVEQPRTAAGPITKPIPRALRPSVHAPTHDDISGRLFRDQSRSRSPFDFGEQHSFDEPTLDDRQSRGAFSAHTTTTAATTAPSTAPVVTSVGDPSVSRGRGPRRATADFGGSAGDTRSPTNRTTSPSLPRGDRLSPSRAPLPRFHPGDRICRNGKRETVACDFGGAVGTVLCGESLVVNSVTSSATHPGFQFTVEGGDRIPSVSDVEELFDLATSGSSSSSDSDDSVDDSEITFDLGDGNPAR